MYLLPGVRTAETKYHQLGGLNNNFFIVWRLEVQKQDVGRVGSLRGP